MHQTQMIKVALLRQFLCVYKDYTHHPKLCKRWYPLEYLPPPSLTLIQL